MPERKPVVDIAAVTKRYNGKPALDNLSAVCYPGEILGLAGPDGAGKTTLIRLIAGLLKPDTGTITVAGMDTIKDAEKLHESIGYMPQLFGLYEDLTVMQNLTLYADLRGVCKEERKQTFERLFQFTNLRPFVSRLAGDLSGGMKQKLGLACALVKKPLLLLLDEPSVGVDPLSRRDLWKMVKALIDTGVSVVWSTSYLDEASNCDRTLLLNDGIKLFEGAPDELTSRVKSRVFFVGNIPEHERREALEKFVDSDNVLDGIIQGSRLRIVTFKEQNPPFDLGKYADIAKVLSTKPRFEDAYVDIIGKKQVGKSLLAEKTAPIKPVTAFPVEAKDLTKRFGNFTAASHISFQIKPGEIFGLLGPNGAGKSTIFKMLCGLLKPSSGEGLLNGHNIALASAQARMQLGYMAQKFSLYSNISVKQNLEYFAGIYNLRGKKKEERIQEMIAIFDLKPYLNTTAGELPLGFKQRLALSCALIHNPSVLFLDEPTSGVDPLTRREFWSHMNGLVRKGVTILVTTHFMEEAEYCDRIALIYRSEMIETGDPESVRKKAATADNLDPTLEEAFIKLIENYDANHAR